MMPPQARMMADDGSARLPDVLVVDDSSVARAIIARSLAGRANIVGFARNGREALALLGTARADIVLLDVEMPELDGLSALPEIVAMRGPTVLIVSSATATGAAASIEALRLGAADTLAKPSVAVAGELSRFEDILITKVDGLFAEREGTGRRRAPAMAAPPAGVRLRTSPPTARVACLAIGASTGGPQALHELIEALPDDFEAPILITQHLPPPFMSVFARHLHRHGRPATVAEDGMPVTQRTILVAPGHAHLRISRLGTRLVAKLDDSRAANGCCPSVDPMFESVGEVFGARGLAVMLSGMGHDGADGAARLVDAGGALLVQDEESSVVWGMPGAVARDGLASALLSPRSLAAEIGRRGRIG